MQWNLIKLRKEHKLTQEKMAKISKLSVVSYGKKERGDIQFSLEEMFLISKHFKLPMEVIFLPRSCTDSEVKDKKG